MGCINGFCPSRSPWAIAHGSVGEHSWLLHLITECKLSASSINLAIGFVQGCYLVTRCRGHPAWNHDATGAFNEAAWFGLRTSKNTSVNRLGHSYDWCDSWAKENAGVPTNDTNDTNENLALILNVEIGPTEPRNNSGGAHPCPTLAPIRSSFRPRPYIKTLGSTSASPRNTPHSKAWPCRVVARLSKSADKEAAKKNRG